MDNHTKKQLSAKFKFLAELVEFFELPEGYKISKNSKFQINTADIDVCKLKHIVKSYNKKRDKILYFYAKHGQRINPNYAQEILKNNFGIIL